MSEHVQHHHADEHPDDHEHSDVSVRGIAITMTALVVVGLIVHVGLWVLFGVYERQADDIDQKRQLTDIPVEHRQRAKTTAPPLQGIPGYHDNTPADDTREMKREDEKQLTSSYDREDGSRKIPIDDAMRLLVEKNMLPVRHQQPEEGQ